MKRICILIFIIILIKNNIFAQILDENQLNAIDIEYSILYNELLEIVKNEFVMPIHNDEIIFVYNDYYGYGLHINPFTGRIYFSNGSYLKCNYGTSIFSMTSGIVKNIIFERMIIIDYNGIEIFYRDLDINNNINIGDAICSGQLLGTLREVDAMHNFFNGIIIKIKYGSFYFDIGYILNLIRNNIE